MRAQGRVLLVFVASGQIQPLSHAIRAANLFHLDLPCAYLLNF